MCVDVEPGMRTAAAAVGWEAAAKILLLVLASSLLDRGALQQRVLQQHPVLQQHGHRCCSSTCCCCCCCCCGRSSRTRMWWSTGSHPTESLVEQNCVSSGYWLCVSHGPKAAVPRNPDGKKTTKTNNYINVKKSRQHTHMHLLVRDNT